MKTIARTYAVWAAIVLVPGSSALAATSPWHTTSWLASGAIGQFGGDSNRAQSDKLLQAARQAIEAGNLAQAEQLLAEAESLDVTYGFLSTGDTPKKVRKDLERAQGSVTLPSEKATQVGARPEAAPNATPLSATGVGNTLTSISGSDAKSKALVYLKRGRDGLSAGDLMAARHWHRMAALEGAEFGPDEDSPYKLAQDINQAGGRADLEPMATPAFNPLAGPIAPPTEDDGHPLGLSATRPTKLPPVDGAAPAARDPWGAEIPGVTSGNPFGEQPIGDPRSNVQPRNPGGLTSARTASDNLLLDARRSLAFGDVARAKAKLSEAQLLGVQYQLHEDQPQKVSTAIEKYEMLKQRQAEGLNSEAYNRQFASLLMEQAEGLIAWSDLKTAEQLVMSAGQLPVNYAPFEKTPRDLLARIAEIRRTGAAGAAPGALPAEAVRAAQPVAGPALPPDNQAKTNCLQLLNQARAAMAAGDLEQAHYLAETAAGLQVPDSAFAPQEDRPSLVLFDIRQAGQGMANRNPAGVIPAGGEQAARGQAGLAVYEESSDTTRNIPATSQGPLTDGFNFPSSQLAAQPGGESSTPFPASNADAFSAAPQVPSAGSTEQDAPQVESVQPPAGKPTDPTQLIQWGETALSGGDPNLARTYFQEANARRDQLAPAQQQQLEFYLRLLNPATENVLPAAQPGELLPETSEQQKLLATKLSVELARIEASSNELRATDPETAIKQLREARQMVETSGLDARSRDILLRRVDRGLADLEKYVMRNQPLIDLERRNREVRQQIADEQTYQLESQEKLARLTEEFNNLMHEQRFAEAELVARKAEQLMPDNPVVVQLREQSRMAFNLKSQMDIRDSKNRGFLEATESVDLASIPFNDQKPYQHGPIKDWKDLTARRRLADENTLRRSEKEIEIEHRLRTPVSVDFQNTPLSQVISYLGNVTQVPMYLDPQGLAEEGITTDEPVNLSLSQEISLKSALNLILEPRRLAYVIKDEVLKITSEHLRDGQVYSATYNVADLVIKIPNFVPTADMGMAGSLKDAYATVGFGRNGMGLGGGSPLAYMASQAGGTSNTRLNPNVLAQNAGIMGGGGASGTPQNIGFGPGGAGGGAQADFDSLIELITSTVSPTTWDDVGGPGSIREFETNLSLVISQTQEVHEQIVDLLEQLRRLQDLQVTIEVRFITLNDNFFERIGVDFDFDIDDKIDRPFQVFGKPLDGEGDASTNRDLRDRDYGPSVTVGQSQPGVFSADLDIPFRQDSYSLAVPQFGGFDAAAGASLGFAILSDLEAFFFINAAQGDRRSNVLQAPKVTLFNGQQATVSDVSQSPFVISVIPVVGDFAAAQQPVIVVLSEGTFLTVQAVVSSDRRFVRLTVVPFFSQIGEVNTFTFTGSSTTTEDTSSEGPDDDTTSRSNARTTITEGTSVQLPTFAFVSVSTTVSVPDGGTVLLGGIKRLAEGRNEFGVPLLNKIPYVNRLFQNVGIGRETQSLMMMVTPRIIIQEEEEELLGIAPNP